MLVRFGSESWELAVGLGVGLLIVAWLPLWFTRSLSRHSRHYFEVRSALLALVGVGIAVGHWAPSAGGTTIALAFLGLVLTFALRRRLLRNA